MPAKARVIFPSEFRSAALSSAGAARGGVRLALRPSESAQVFEIARNLDHLTPSDGRFSAIVELASSRSKTAKGSEKDTQAFENMESSTKWRPQKLASWDKNGPQTSPNLALLPKEDVLAVFC